MTNKEAKEIIKSECYVFNPLDLDKSTRINMALDVAIQALEQEPCEDCISRKALLDKKWDVPYDGKYIQVVDVGDIKELPPATPARKKGKWINRSSTSSCGIRYVASECSCCHKKTFFDCDQLVYRYCPNCGAEMESDNKDCPLVEIGVDIGDKDECVIISWMPLPKDMESKE